MSIKPIHRLVCSTFIAGFILLAGCTGSAPEAWVDETDQARRMLEEERTETLNSLEEEINAPDLNKLVELGLWDRTQSILDEHGLLDDEFRLVQARLFMKRHRYRQAESLVTEVMEANAGNREAKLLKAKLDIQAWNLEEADRSASELLGENSRDAEAGLIRGQVALLNRDYDGAVEWARRVQDWDDRNGGGYLLEAEARFWAQDPAGAEPALVRAIELNPWDPDARFSYGYAIWRRVDATQLDDMAAQWNLAFEVNPLHYLTHWHIGNGHTNLTYTDYAHETDSLVRPLLQRADRMIPQNRLDEAIAITREVELEYPESVLPAMMRGSIYYMYYDMDREARLDSAQSTFESILARKQNYGPAHNALAAVIKQRQAAYLDEFDELEQVIAETPIPEEGAVFYEIFRDAEYYPGDRVKRMIAQQIGPSKAYLPLIHKFNSDFAIPPLHKDLAEAMDRSFFRFGTTFDNRQWMDIRGVGSGATGIEYLERGAYLERNVLAHEYAHLYHGRILSDRESRRIRALYHEAMEHGRTLDYYASNNESEFFAQGYAGFLAERKVHPLNHKSMNTREFIREKDPAYYAFLDSLLQKQEEYLAGNREVFNDNWAQAYLSLSGRNGGRQAEAYLDTALTYSSDYVPVLLEYAMVKSEDGDFEGAQQWLARAAEQDSGYAPLYVTEANVIHEQAMQGMLSFEEALNRQVPLLERAWELENDLAERAQINSLHRRRLQDYGDMAGAIAVAERYLQDAPTVSTYLRDRKEDTEAYARYLHGSMGHTGDVLEFFEELVAQNPQNFELRRMYADMLQLDGQSDNALTVLEEGQQILAASNSERSDYALRIARIHAGNGNTEVAETAVESVDGRISGTGDRLLLAELYAEMGRQEEGMEHLPDSSGLVLPADRAEWHYVHGQLVESTESGGQAETDFRAALDANPWHLKARAALIRLLEDRGETGEADRLREEGEQLGLRLNENLLAAN